MTPQSYYSLVRLWCFYGWMLFINAIIYVQFINDKNASQISYMGGEYNHCIPAIQISSQILEMLYEDSNRAMGPFMEY